MTTKPILKRVDRQRRSRCYSPSLDLALESRELLSTTSAFDPAVTLPHQQVGSTFDMMVPGLHLGSTHEIVSGPDGNLWVTQQNQGMLVRLTPSGQITEWSMGANSGPHGIEFDKQGRLWITRQFSNTITQVVIKGGAATLINHPIPFANSNPHGLTVATNGDIWFTGREGNIVGYYDPNHDKFKIFKLGNPDPSTNPEDNGNFPIYIKQAPNGSMYFTNLLTSRVSEITQSGKLTQFPLPSTFGPPNDARPIAVYAKDSGVVVVSEESGHAYAYIQKNGLVSEYHLTPPADSEAASLTYDRQNTLWVQYNTPDDIARVNPDGSLSIFPIPTTDAVQHRITIGPDGELWYTELKADKIGRMVTGHADGPSLDGVASQSYSGTPNGIDGLNDRATFAQGYNTYNAHYTLTVQGTATAADRQNSIVHFIRNLQGDINGTTLSSSKYNPKNSGAIYGLQQPAYTAEGVKTSYKIKGGLVTFQQVETIGNAVYTHTLTLRIGHNSAPPINLTNLSSATAHFLEAVEVESGGGGVI